MSTEQIDSVKKTKNLIFRVFALFLLLAFYAPPAMAQNEQETSQPKDTMQGERIFLGLPPTPTPNPFPTLSSGFDRDFIIGSTDGLSGRLAFTATIGNYERILVLDLDSRRVRRLIDGPGNNSYPSWSPDGKSVVFTSDRDGQSEIYIADWEGNNQRRLTRSQNSDNASWSPDGKKIVYYSETGHSRGQAVANIFTLGLESGSRPTQITNFDGRNTTPRWSPDGRVITYSTNRFWPGWDVCNWDLAAREENCFLTGTDTYCRATWASSGNALAYSFGSFDQIYIGLLDFNTRQQTKITNLPGRDYDPIWMADDKFLAFVAEGGTRDNYNIYTIELEDNKQSVLLDAPYSFRFLSWSPVRTLELEAQRIREAEEKRIRDAEERRRKAMEMAVREDEPDLENGTPSADSTPDS